MLPGAAVARVDRMGIYQRQLLPRLLTAQMSGGPFPAIRRRVCEGLHGDVLEIGYGSGLNQPYLPPAVTRVSAVEPSVVGLRLARTRQAASAVPVVVVGEDVQHLALPDDSFDAALCTWSLCGVPDPSAALREIARVLRPGGVLHFVEHGLAPDAKVARWQRRLSRLNKRVVGCVLDRDVPALVAGAGLILTALDSYDDPDLPRAAGHFYEGRAAA